MVLVRGLYLKDHATYNLLITLLTKSHEPLSVVVLSCVRFRSAHLRNAGLGPRVPGPSENSLKPKCPGA